MNAGDVVGERFEITGFHRAGGMGEVFRARDRTSGSLVAIKLVKRVEGTAEQRFEREVAILSAMRDAGIVEYIAHGEAPDGRRFLAMEWLEGEDLADRLARGPLSAADAVAMGLCVARALATAHARDVVHRDLKPENVFLVAREPTRAKLVDFGLARTGKPVPEITRTGMTVGTRGYMSPEQALGEKNVGAKADLFALGCVLYEATLGQAPFYSAQAEDVLRKIVFEDVAPLVEVVPGVPTKLSALVDTLLSKEPADRPRDASAVVQTLEAIAAEMVVDGVLLVVIEGPDTGRRFVCAELPLDIGKHPSATVALSDRAASRFHCELRRERGVFVARDLGSRNGLTVDGVKVDFAPFTDNAVLGIGLTKINAVRIEVAPAPTPLARACLDDAHVLACLDGPEALDLAVRVHEASARARGPFVIIEAASYREEDVVRASGGTAFVRDLDRLARPDQEALAALLESRTSRVGGASRLVDTRVVATSGVDLRIAVNEGKLDPALYARLAGVRFLGAVASPKSS